MMESLAMGGWLSFGVLVNRVWSEDESYIGTPFRMYSEYSYASEAVP